jgi:predicted transcriptional regulator
MANRRHGELAFVENNMADVAAAEMALARLWCHLRTWCRRPAVTMEQIDAVTLELREIELGLAAARRGLIEERKGV